jgi:hypothetical protein
MIVDCDFCAVRGAACGDCVITVLLGEPPGARPATVRLDDTERRALDALAGAGMVPRLRLVPVAPPGSSHNRRNVARRPRVSAKRSTWEAG